MTPTVKTPPHMTCPGCGSEDVHRSRRHRFERVLAIFFGRYPFRCEWCSDRFFARSRG